MATTNSGVLGAFIRHHWSCNRLYAQRQKCVTYEHIIHKKQAHAFTVSIARKDPYL